MEFDPNMKDDTTQASTGRIGAFKMSDMCPFPNCFINGFGRDDHENIIVMSATDI